MSTGTKVLLERKGLSRITQSHPVAVYFKSPPAARRSQRCQSAFPVDKDGASGPLWCSPCLSAGATDYGAILKPNPRFVTPLFFFRLLLFVTIGWRPYWNVRGSRRGFYYDKPYRQPENVLPDLFVLLDLPRPDASAAHSCRLSYNGP